jgi:hypothetical protein
VLLRRTHREGGKVKHRPLGSLTGLPETAIEALRRSLNGEELVPADEVFGIERSTPQGHVRAVRGTIKRLGLPDQDRVRCADFRTVDRTDDLAATRLQIAAGAASNGNADFCTFPE